MAKSLIHTILNTLIDMVRAITALYYKIKYHLGEEFK